MSDICDTYGIHPSVYYRWQKQFFEQGNQAFASNKDTAETQLQAEVRRLEDKLARKDAVPGEVMEELVTLKKLWPPLTGERISREVRDEVVAFVQQWQSKTRYDVTRFINWLGIGRSKYYSMGWAGRCF